MNKREKELSVIVPVIEHPHPLDALYEEFAAPLRESGFRFEFLFVFEPGYASMVPSVTRLMERGEPVRVLELAYASGETTLLRVGEVPVRLCARSHRSDSSSRKKPKG